jgi:SecD/SecF fusion protein
MKKSKAIIVLLIMVLLIGGLGYTTAFGIGSEKTGAAEGIKLGLDLAGGVSITYQVKGDEEPSAEDMSDTIYKLQKRVEGYSTEAQVYQEGSDRINIEIPGVSDANAVLEELGKPGSLYFVDEEGNTVVEGTQIKSATAVTTNDSTTGNKDYAVDLVLTEEGSKAFAEATAKAAPEKKKIYIYYDDALVSAPTVQSEITGGEAYITNMESFEEAEQLASTIRIGGLKLELEELRSNVVGAQLGSTAINTSLKAGIIGFAIVALFMIVVYFIPGLASAIALSLYVIFILLFLKGFDLTLTLPGIAGIILSIGMAVDANVIIFARIREEITSGKTVKSAIKIGFEKALSAIIDGNVTTLIAAFVLGIKGTGSVKGFAQTLALGIVLSMFTALFITKLILNAFYALGLQDIKFYGQARKKKVFNFISKKSLCFGISILLILSGFVFMGLNQSKTGSILNYSLEFMGGTSTNVTFNEDMSIEALESDVIPLIEDITGDGFIQKSKVADTNEVIFKTRTLTVNEREKFNAAMEEKFSVSENMITTETISSTISSEMKVDAIIAVLIATICMLIYIWFRFKDLRFAASAVLALCHDVLIVLAFYAFAKVPVGGTFIACMLTIIGYSINATIVIFDRIRENNKLMRKEELATIVNTSISQTLSRSIFTSLTTFITIAILYVLGVTSIKEFALPLMVGVVCGTYSSVCVAGSLWYVMKTKIANKKTK